MFIMMESRKKPDKKEELDLAILKKKNQQET